MRIRRLLRTLRILAARFLDEWVVADYDQHRCIGFLQFLPAIAAAVGGILGAKGAKQQAANGWQEKEDAYKRGFYGNEDQARRSYTATTQNLPNRNDYLRKLLLEGRLMSVGGGKGKGPATLLKYLEEQRRPYDFTPGTYVPSGTPKPSTGLGFGDFLHGLVSGASALPARGGVNGGAYGGFNGVPFDPSKIKFPKVPVGSDSIAYPL